MHEFAVGNSVGFQVDDTWRTGVIMAINDKLAKISVPNIGVKWVPVDLLYDYPGESPAEAVHHAGHANTNVARFHFIVLYEGAPANVLGVDAGEMNLSGIGWVPIDDPKLGTFDRDGSEQDDEEEDASES